MLDNTKQPRSRDTRRNFLKSTGAIAAGAYLARTPTARAEGETLALDGGSKAVTVP